MRDHITASVAALTDAELTRRAIDTLTDGNRSAFARAVGLDVSGVKRRLSGATTLTATERRYYALMINHPREFRRWLDA